MCNCPPEATQQFPSVFFSVYGIFPDSSSAMKENQPECRI